MRLRVSVAGVLGLLAFVVPAGPASAVHRNPGFVHIDHARVKDAGRLVVRATFWCADDTGLGYPDGPGARIQVDEYTEKGVKPFEFAFGEVILDGIHLDECDGMEHEVRVRMKPSRESGPWFHGGIANVYGSITTCCVSTARIQPLPATTRTISDCP